MLKQKVQDAPSVRKLATNEGCMLRRFSKQFTVAYFNNHKPLKPKRLSSADTFLIEHCLRQMYLATTDLWSVGGTEDHVRVHRRLNSVVSGRQITFWTVNPRWECSTSTMIWVRNSPRGHSPMWPLRGSAAGEGVPFDLSALNRVYNFKRVGPAYSLELWVLVEYLTIRIRFITKLLQNSGIFSLLLLHRVFE